MTGKHKGHGHDNHDEKHGGKHEHGPKDHPAPPLPSPPHHERPETPVEPPPPPVRREPLVQSGIVAFGHRRVVVVRPDQELPDVMNLLIKASEPDCPPRLIQKAVPWEEAKRDPNAPDLRVGHLMLENDRVVVVLDPNMPMADLDGLIVQASDPNIDWDKVQRGRAWADIYLR